jgi:hypothetical protein
VAKVVCILYLATGREVTHDVIDVWAVVLSPVPDGDDAIEVAVDLARTVEFVTLAQFFKSLVASRRRRALAAEQSRRDFAAAEVRVVGMTDADWNAFVNGCRQASAEMGKPAPNLPDHKPESVSFAQIIAGLFASPAHDPEAAA